MLQYCRRLYIKMINVKWLKIIRNNSIKLPVYKWENTEPFGG